MSRTTHRPNAQALQEEKKERYLDALRALGTLTAGCAAAHVSPHTVYTWREESDAFTFAEREARNAFADGLEHEAVKRALNGSDVLLIFLLKAARPDKYREKLEQTTHGSIVVRYVNDWRQTPV